MAAGTVLIILRFAMTLGKKAILSLSELRAEYERCPEPSKTFIIWNTLVIALQLRGGL
jgi:hypothetical protein